MRHSSVESSQGGESPSSLGAKASAGRMGGDLPGAEGSSTVQPLRLARSLAPAVRARVFCAAALVFLGLPFGAAASAADLLTEWSALDAQFAASLTALADQAQQQGRQREAELTRAWQRPRDPLKVYLVDLPSAVTPKDDPLAGTDEAWRERFLLLRRGRAASLFDLARRAVRLKHSALAYDLAIAALREDPDFSEARRLLGYQPYEGRWCTAYEARKLRAGQIWDDRFGWIAAKDLPKYEAGQRPAGTRWISAEEDAKRHDNILRGWDIETEHFQIVTDHSLEAGVRLASELERFYRLWQQAFATYGVAPEQLARMFEGRAGAQRPRPRHQVVYYRDAEEYRAALEPFFGETIRLTTGTYVGTLQGRNPRAFFYHTDDDDFSVLYHEITHQLFAESRVSYVQVGAGANFWIIEGIACYMESLREGDGFATLGGADAVRLGAARHRRLVDQFAVPLAELVTYGADRLQRDPEIAKLYSQAAGLTNFLMHYRSGYYRDALLGYLEAVYSRRDTPQTLAELTGQSYGELDEQYRAFLEALPERTAVR